MYISKRLKAFAVIVLSTVALQGQGPQSASPQEFKMEPIRAGKVYLVYGGTNVEAIIGKTGVIVVDSKTTKQNGEDIIKAIATVTPLPITHIILTHSDCDHANGIIGFPASVKVMATNEQFDRTGTDAAFRDS